YVANEIKRYKKGVAIFLAALFAAFGYGWYEFATHKPAPSSPAIKMARLTSTGKVFAGLISPDGKNVVYGVEDAGRQSIWLMQVATSSNVQVVPPSEAKYANLSFAHSGNYIYFNRQEKDAPESLYQMP